MRPSATDRLKRRCVLAYVRIETDRIAYVSIEADRLKRRCILAYVSIETDLIAYFSIEADRFKRRCILARQPAACSVRALVGLYSIKELLRLYAGTVKALGPSSSASSMLC